MTGLLEAKGSVDQLDVAEEAGSEIG